MGSFRKRRWNIALPVVDVTLLPELLSAGTWQFLLELPSQFVRVGRTVSFPGLSASSTSLEEDTGYAIHFAFLSER
jgi:hypothetical protein